MDRSAVEKIVNENVRRIRWETQTQDWDIAFRYEPDSQDRGVWAGSCARQPAYRQAQIFIDPNRALSEADVLDTLRHELLHVVLAPFDQFYGTARQLLGDDPTALRVLGSVWEYAVEMAVGNLERMQTHAGVPNPFHDPGKPAEPAPDVKKRSPRKVPKA